MCKVEMILDLGGKAFNLREHRIRQRQELLNRVIPDRKCSSCEFVKPNSAQWVQIPMRNMGYFTQQVRRLGVVCRACYNKAVL